MIGNSWDKVLKEMFDSKEYQAFFQKIEKEYQNGGNALRRQGFRIESLASIKQINGSTIIFN